MPTSAPVTQVASSAASGTAGASRSGLVPSMGPRMGVRTAAGRVEVRRWRRTCWARRAPPTAWPRRAAPRGGRSGRLQHLVEREPHGQAPLAAVATLAVAEGSRPTLGPWGRREVVRAWGHAVPPSGGRSIPSPPCATARPACAEAGRPRGGAARRRRPGRLPDGLRRASGSSVRAARREPGKAQRGRPQRAAPSLNAALEPRSGLIVAIPEVFAGPDDPWAAGGAPARVAPWGQAFEVAG